MRKSMQSILGILTGTAIAATTMLGVVSVGYLIETVQDVIQPYQQ